MRNIAESKIPQMEDILRLIRANRVIPVEYLARRSPSGLFRFVKVSLIVSSAKDHEEIRTRGSFLLRARRKIPSGKEDYGR